MEGHKMIVLNLELKGIYGFDDFHINFSYPKKIVNSIIEHEHLKGRERFRYKKAVILMGANATGKTSLGKALLRIFGYISDGNPSPLFDMAADNNGYFCIDFVNGDYRLQRLAVRIDALNEDIDIRYQTADIDTMSISNGHLTAAQTSFFAASTSLILIVLFAVVIFGNLPSLLVSVLLSGLLY